jgi:hypothetical protein
MAVMLAPESWFSYATTKVAAAHKKARNIHPCHSFSDVSRLGSLPQFVLHGMSTLPF